MHGKKDKTAINQDVDGLFIFTLTYRGGEPSFGRETADQQQDGEYVAGAWEKKARNLHCSTSATSAS